MLTSEPNDIDILKWSKQLLKWTYITGKHKKVQKDTITRMKMKTTNYERTANNNGWISNIYLFNVQFVFFIRFSWKHQRRWNGMPMKLVGHKHVHIITNSRALFKVDIFDKEKLSRNRWWFQSEKKSSHFDRLTAFWTDSKALGKITNV